MSVRPNPPNVQEKSSNWFSRAVNQGIIVVGGSYQGDGFHD